MNEDIINKIAELLKQQYTSSEDQLREGDITKEMFREVEVQLSLIADLIGVKNYYPYNKLNL
jgi:hypothetical protein